MAEDKITRLHKTFLKEGYAMEPEEEFRKNISDPDKRRAAYDALVKSGYDMEPFEEFESNIGFGGTSVTAGNATANPAVGSVDAATTASGEAANSTESKTEANAVHKTLAKSKTQKRWKPSVQEKIRMRHNMNQSLWGFNANMQAKHDRHKRAMKRYTPEGRKELKALETQAKIAGAKTTPTIAGTGGAGSPVAYGTVPDENGKQTTQYMLRDGTLTTNAGEVYNAETLARAERLQNEAERRARKNGLDPAKKEDMKLQTAIDAVQSGYDIDPEAREEVRKEMEDNGLDPEDAEHIKWVVTGDERSILQHRLETAEERLRELHDQRKEKQDKAVNEGSWLDRLGATVNAANSNMHPTAYNTSGLEKSELDRDIENATAEVAKLSQTLRKYDKNERASGKSWLGKIAQGVWDGLTDPNTLTMGVYDASVNSTARRAKVDTETGRNLLRSYGEAEQLMQTASNPGMLYTGGRFAGEMLGDPITYISGGVGELATKSVMKGGAKAIGRKMTTEVGERYMTNTVAGRLIGRYGAKAAGGGANLFTFEALRDMRQQWIDGGYSDEEGNFHQGFSMGHALRQGGHGLILGSTMGLFGAGMGQAGDWVTKMTKSTAGKVGTRTAQHTVDFVGEGTIFAMPDIIEFHTMDDSKFDKLYAEKFNYAKEKDPKKRAAAREAARNSVSWDAWADSQAMVFGMKVGGAIANPMRAIGTVRSTLSGLSARDRRDHRSFAERLSETLDRSPFDVALTKDEHEELRNAGYTDLADLFRDSYVKKGGSTKDLVKIEPTANRAETRAEDYDGYTDMERLMRDTNVSESARAKAYFILTGHMLPMSTVMDYKTEMRETGKDNAGKPEYEYTVSSLNAKGEKVTSRKFNSQKAAMNEEKAIARQSELNLVDVGEQYAESAANSKVIEAAMKELFPEADQETLTTMYARLKATDPEHEMNVRLNEAIARNEHIADSERPEAIRKEINERYETDIDKVLRKPWHKRSVEEADAVREYVKRLYPEDTREDPVHRGAADYSPKEPEVYPELPYHTGMQDKARITYEVSRKLIERKESGDAKAQPEIDAIALRMHEALDMCEDAFGAEAEYYMYRMEEDPMSLLEDQELTTDQREAIVNYINSRAAMEGVADAAEESADGKRNEVERTISRRTHTDTGLLQKAVMKVDDREVYIVKGHVEMFPDGSGVDHTRSEQSVIVCDAQTGELSYTSPDQIMRVEEGIDPAEEREAALSAIDAEQTSVFGDNLEENPLERGREEPGSERNEPEQPEKNEVPENTGAIEEPANSEERPIADTEAYDRGYEHGVLSARQMSDEAIGHAVEQMREMYANRTLNDEGRGALEALEGVLQEREARMSETPAENVSNPAAPVENVQETPAPTAEPTPLQRIPRDAKGEPVFEQAENPEHGWDALVEFAEGDAATAKEIADTMAEEKRKAYEKAQKQKPKGKTPTEILASKKAISAGLAQAEQEYNLWQQMANVEQRRQDAIRAQQEAQARQRAAERAEAEKAEREAREEAARLEREALEGIPEWHLDTPENARKRGVRRFSGQMFQRQEPVQGVVGNEVEVKFSQKDLPKGHVAVIEASQLQPSHIQGQRNPMFFIEEAQPKNRAEAVSMYAAKEMAEGIRPQEITGSATAYTGAPTVNTRGEVIQGNNRSDALRYLWENKLPEQQQTYKQYLIDNAEQFGLDPEAVNAMQHPVLVNMLDVDDAEAIRLGQMTAQDTESGGIERIKPKNVAQKLGEDMRSFASQLLRSGDEEASFSQLVDRNGTEVMKWMAQKGAITNTQYQSAFDSKGNLTAEAKNDLQKVLYQAVFKGGSQQLEEMFDALPAKAQRAILSTAFRDMDSPFAGKMLPEIQSSIAAFNQLMNDPTFAAAKKMEEVLRVVEGFKLSIQLDDRFEQYMPADNFSNFALHLAAMYKANDLSQTTLTSYFNQMYDLAQGKKAATLFEEADTTEYPLADVIKKVLNIDYKPAKNGNNNVANGGADVALRNQDGQGGELRGNEPPASGEQNPTGTEPADRGAGVEDDSAAAGGRGDVQPTDERQSNLQPSASEEVNTSSTEFDEDGAPFVISSNGSTTFGEIRKESGLAAAPIKLSLGNSKYGRIHLEKRHGSQIRNAGFNSVEEFVEFVAQNYTHIKVGENSVGEANGTYLLQIEDEHNNTLYIELSTDGTYWGVNSGGVFRKGYGNNKKEVWSASEEQNEQSVADNTLRTEDNADNPAVPNGNVSNTSDGKVTNSLPKEQITSEKSSMQPADSEGASTQAAVEAANAEVNTNPTPAQAEAGNYKHGYVTIGDFNIKIENPAGSVRKGTDANGNAWETKMANTYGEIQGTESTDGDALDVFLAGDMDEWNGRKVYVVDQTKPDGSFDEHKVMLGFNDKDAAMSAYLANYDDKWAQTHPGLRISEANIEDFNKWVQSSHRKTKPFADYKSVRDITYNVGQTPTNVNEEGMIVDAEGKPLTLYHGTPNDVELADLLKGIQREAKEYLPSSTPAEAEETHNGYKIGDEVMWDRYGNGKWEKVKIEDFDADGSPIFGAVKGIMSEKGDWSRVKPADGIFGEALRVARAEQEKKKKATADAVTALTGNKSKKSRKKDVTLKPEQPIGDLFGGLFDNPQNSSNHEETKMGTRPGEAGGQRQQLKQDTQVGGDEPRRETERPAGEAGSGSTGMDSDADRTGGRGLHDVATQPALERLPEKERKNIHNNHVERGTEVAPKSESARIKANIAAIETMNKLEASGDTPTAADMKKLRAFSGWGGLGKAFSDWDTSRQLRQLLGDKLYDEGAEMSRNSAYFTPAYIVDAMWDIARAMGFKGGRVLEGSAGIGNVLGLMPQDLSERSYIRAVEKDPTTGKMLSLLYPDAVVDIDGFEKVKIETGTYDLVITNVPFVPGLKVADTSGDADISKEFKTSIHDFCIAKNVRKLRDGGVGVFITTAGSMDGTGRLYKWLTNRENADIVGMFRMHNETFGGTNATSDIIVVRKRVNGVKSPHAIDCSLTTGVRTAEYNTGETKKVKNVGEIPIIKTLSMSYNRYYVEHPEHMAGEMHFGFEKGDTSFRPESKGLYPVKEKDQSQLLSQWVEDMKRNLEDASEETAPTVMNHRDEYVPTYDKVGNEVKTGTIVVDSQGRICVNYDGTARPLMSKLDNKSPKSADERIAQFNKNKVKGRTRAQVVQDYNAIKKALNDLLEFQKASDSDEGLQPKLKALNGAYDSFVATYGHLHGNNGVGWLKNDVDYPSVIALETYREEGLEHKKVFGKADIFSRRVVVRPEQPKATNVRDGVTLSIRQTGSLDTRYIAEQLGMNEADVRREVIEAGLGYENPLTHSMEAAHEYLSGNVREKMQQAEANNEDGRYTPNITALRKVVPHTIPSHFIEFSIGSSWLRPELFEQYVKERTGASVKLTYAGGMWVMDKPRWTGEQDKSFGIRSEVCDKVITGTELIEAAMTNRTIRVSKQQKDGPTISDPKATSACAAKVDEIRDDFKSWLRSRMEADPELAKEIEERYNDIFNNSAPMTIPDEYIPEYFDGAARVIGGKHIKMREHQAKAIVRGTMQSLMLAHEVGTGKTFTLITTAMEMRRLGTAKKPMIVVQNATLGQFVASAKALYPDARILSLEDRDRNAEGRKDFYAKIRYNDWDMVVIPQSVLERIPDHPDRERRFIEESIQEKMEVIEAMSKDREAGRAVAALKKDVENLRDRLNKLSDTETAEGGVMERETVTPGSKPKKDGKRAAIAKENAKTRAEEMLNRATDDTLNFDDLGVDAILVDEAHEYKHLGFATAMQRGVKGVDPSYSKKCQGLYLKVKAVQEKSGGRNVIFATGTPISNTAAEVWTFMRYLLPREVMEGHNIWYFDDFVRNFGSIQQMLEFTTQGTYNGKGACV